MESVQMRNRPNLKDRSVVRSVRLVLTAPALDDEGHLRKWDATTEMCGESLAS